MENIGFLMSKIVSKQREFWNRMLKISLIAGLSSASLTAVGYVFCNVVPGGGESSIMSWLQMVIEAILYIPLFTVFIILGYTRDTMPVRLSFYSELSGTSICIIAATNGALGSILSMVYFLIRRLFQK